MAVGKYQLQLGPDQFISGMASSDYATDGALGTSSSGLNPFVTPGVIRAIANGTDISTNISANILASCEDSNTVGPQNRYFIDDSTNAANYYYFNGTAVTKVKTGTASGTTYVAGKSDFISYNGFFYGSSPTVLNKWDGSTSLTEAYKTFGDGNAHHPMVLYAGKLYIGDGNTFSTLDSAGTYSTSVSFNASPKEKIVAVGVDPGTGLLMVSVQTVYDVSDSIPSLKAVYLWDGVSTSATRKILVDDLITAFFPLEGQVYIGAGQTIGVWNGSGVTFLRKLQNVAISNLDLPYKHHFCNIRNILMVIDGANVLSYGAVVSGKKGFFYTALNTASSNHLSIVMPLGSNKVGVAYATNKLISFDFSSSSAGTATLYFNNIYFPRPVFIRRVRIITTGITTTAGIGGCSIFDEKGNQYNTQIVSFKVLSAETPKYVFDFDYSDTKLQGIQPRITLDTQAFGVIRVYIYYDIGE